MNVVGSAIGRVVGKGDDAVVSRIKRQDRGLVGSIGPLGAHINRAAVFSGAVAFKAGVAGDGHYRFRDNGAAQLGGVVREGDVLQLQIIIPVVVGLFVENNDGAAFVGCCIAVKGCVLDRMIEIDFLVVRFTEHAVSNGDGAAAFGFISREAAAVNDQGAGIDVDSAAAVGSSVVGEG